ncbi:alpha/beta fold hydrolase [Chryseolinea lacunae]|uniref:Alpha/beta hydrolase n=1 Tax=Chryseolinea lacunae TaxID=2801331 RepID=A0ABS1KQE3_9BACT|nr:alpha/beta hydrolase [Chryseolinea lacunae]MBL0741418.1 alpha/beta hydrolase [Chryseolinea lacunae]
MHKLIPFLASLLFLLSCNSNDDSKVSFTESFVQLSTHKITTYSVAANSNYLVVFESGLGNDHTVWQTKNVAEAISAKMDVVVYDRAGYGTSTIDNTPRDINRLRIELEAVVSKYANGRKVILVGHSLGGMIIRDFAVKNPDLVAALLFVDPSHEYYLHPTQAEEDALYNSINSSAGPDFGGTREARELMEDSQYTATLPNLPNIPVVVLTSMQPDPTHTTADKQNLYDAHELLKSGVTDFTHIATTNAGHFIMVDEPALVIDNFNLLVLKLQ